MHFLNVFSLDNDVILVDRKLDLITLEDFINLLNVTTQTSIISRDKVAILMKGIVGQIYFLFINYNINLKFVYSR